MRGLTHPADLGELVGRLAEADLDRSERVRVLRELSATLGQQLGWRVLWAGRRLTDLAVEQADAIAGHVPVRDLLTLRQHYGGLSGDELAAALTRNAARTTAGIGAAAGALTTAVVLAPPTLLAVPIPLLAETLAVIAVEVKLVAELHVVYGRAPQGTRAELAATYLSAWSSRRAVGLQGLAAPVGAVLSIRAKQQMRMQVARRMRRHLAALTPLIAGAVAGAELNRRDTRALGDHLLRDLRPRR